MYSSKNTIDIILYQWNKLVDSSENVTKQRNLTNRIFISLNLAIITLVSLVFEWKSFLLIIGGVLINILWFFIILQYKQLNEAKFNVILKIEKKLPEQPFSDENKFMENQKFCKTFHWYERFLPVLFLLVYLTFILYIFFPDYFNNILV